MEREIVGVSLIRHKFHYDGDLSVFSRQRSKKKAFF
jgi:hypothetical protein